MDFPLLTDIALMLRTSVVVVRLHPEGFPLPAGCRPSPPKAGDQVRLLGKGLMPDSSMAERPTVNRRVVGSSPTLAVSFVRVVGIAAVQLAFN